MTAPAVIEPAMLAAQVRSLNYDYPAWRFFASSAGRIWATALTSEAREGYMALTVECGEAGVAREMASAGYGAWQRARLMARADGAAVTGRSIR